MDFEKVFTEPMDFEKSEESIFKVKAKMWEHEPGKDDRKRSEQLVYKENLLLHLTIPKCFGDDKDQFTPQLFEIPLVRRHVGTVVTLERESADVKYVVCWAGLPIESDDYELCKSRPGDITFVHQHVISPITVPWVGNPVPDDINIIKKAINKRNRSADVTCVRLPSGKYIRMDKAILSRLYQYKKISAGNTDNVIERHNIILNRIPAEIYDDKKKIEAKNTLKTTAAREKRALSGTEIHSSSSKHWKGL